MRISRRTFVLAVPAAGLTFYPRPCARLVERRVYGALSPLPSRELLLRNGMSEVEIRRTPLGFEYVLRFNSLEARVHGWDRVNTDPEWCALRARGEIDLLELSLLTDSRA